MEEDDEKHVDYSSVGLYLAGIQNVFAVVVCACASVLSVWALPVNSISAVRTLAITTISGVFLVQKPLRVGRVRGVGLIFNALRPAVIIYILALIIEQILQTCNNQANSVDLASPSSPSSPSAALMSDAAMFGLPVEHHSTLRRVIYHILMAALIISAFARARAPRSEGDLPFVLAAFCIILIALVPPPSLQNAGPLCHPAGLLEAGERCLRALFFSAVYSVHIYAAAPSRNISNELMISVLRASGASIWILAASTWTLPLAPLQIAVVLFSRLSESSDYQSVASSSNHTTSKEVASHVEEISPLHFASQDQFDEHHVALGGNTSDLEAPEHSVSSVIAALPQVPKIVSAPMHHFHHHVQAGHRAVPSQGSISFALPAVALPSLQSTNNNANGLNAAAIAAALAREGAESGNE